MKMDKKEMDGALWEMWTRGVKLLGEGLVKDQLGILNAACTTVIGCENMIEKGAMFLQRKYYIGKFSTDKRQVAAWAADADALLRECKGKHGVEVEYVSSPEAIYMDADDGLDNESWGDHAIDAFEKLVEYVNNLMDALDTAQKRICEAA